METNFTFIPSILNFLFPKMFPHRAAIGKARTLWLSRTEKNLNAFKNSLEIFFATRSWKLEDSSFTILRIKSLKTCSTIWFRHFERQSRKFEKSQFNLVQSLIKWRETIVQLFQSFERNFSMRILTFQNFPKQKTILAFYTKVSLKQEHNELSKRRLRTLKRSYNSFKCREFFRRVRDTFVQLCLLIRAISSNPSPPLRDKRTNERLKREQWREKFRNRRTY